VFLRIGGLNFARLPTRWILSTEEHSFSVLISDAKVQYFSIYVLQKSFFLHFLSIFFTVFFALCVNFLLFLSHKM